MAQLVNIEEVIHRLRCSMKNGTNLNTRFERVVRDVCPVDAIPVKWAEKWAQDREKTLPAWFWDMARDYEKENAQK